MRFALYLVSLAALLAMQGTPFYSENVTAGTAPLTVESRFDQGWVQVTPSAANDVRVIFSQDLLRGGDFEDKTYNTRTARYLDECDDNVLKTGVNGPWKVSGSTNVAATCANTRTLNGEYALKLAASSVTELILNNDVELVVVDDFDNWTENVNAGTGTIVEEETTVHGGSVAVKLTGGSAHVDFTSDAITVSASTTYTLAVWARLGASGDLIDIRVRESTGGTDYLQSNGTWSASEADLCTASFSDSAFTQCVVRFTTDSGITGITVSAHADVSGDIGFLDDFTLTAQTTDMVHQVSTKRLWNMETDAYSLCFEHYGDTAGVIGEYSIVDPDIYLDETTLAPQYYTGSAWTTTETWIALAGSTTETEVCQAFEARSASPGNFVDVRFRVKTFGDGTALYVDVVRLNDSATTTDALVPLDGRLFQITEPGRFSVIASGSTSVNFAMLR